MEQVFERCRIGNPDDVFDALECVSNGLNDGIGGLSSKVDSLTEGVNTFFVVFASVIMFIMQAGFGMLAAGSVRSKNIQNTLLKHFLDA